jgi:hypothetical protein
MRKHVLVATRLDLFELKLTTFPDFKKFRHFKNASRRRDTQQNDT